MQVIRSVPTTGEGSGDDEVITVDLSMVPEHVEQTFVVIMSWSRVLKCFVTHSLRHTSISSK